MHLQLNASSQATALSKIVNMTRFTLIDVQTKATSPDGLRIFILSLDDEVMTKTLSSLPSDSFCHSGYF